MVVEAEYLIKVSGKQSSISFFIFLSVLCLGKEVEFDCIGS